MPVSQSVDVDSLTATIVVGEGTAGTPIGGVVTVQGTATSGVLPVSSKIDLTPASPATGTVGATSASLVASNANRKGLVIINLSINKVSFGLSGATAVLNSGITLYPGGVWYMDEFSFDTGAVFAIAAAAGSVVSIQEFS